MLVLRWDGIFEKNFVKSLKFKGSKNSGEMEN